MSGDRIPLNKRTFMYGAPILSAAAILIKFLGAAFKIPLANLIDDEGMGYYNVAYPLLVVIATSGIPVAISRLVAEHQADGDPAGANRVFRAALLLVTGIGAAFFCVLFFGAPAITSRMTDLTGAVYAMRAIAPALLFVPIMAAFRGYFQGMQNMKPTALSQLTEQAFRVILGLALAFYLIGMGTEYAAAGGTFGATAGAVAGLIPLMVLYYRMRERTTYRERREEAKQIRGIRKQESTGAILKRILYIAVPITIGASAMPIMYNIDVWVVMDRLVYAGFNDNEALGMYGQLTGFAESLTNLPKVLTTAVAISMVPTIVRAWKEKDKEFLSYNITLGLRIALIIGLPCAVGFMVLAEPILNLLFPLTPEAAAGAVPPLMIFAVGVVFLSSIDALTSVLQGVGKQMIPFVNIVIGAGCKFVLTYVLTGFPLINIKGAALGTVVAYAVATILNYRAVRVYTGTRFDLGLTIVRPLISALVMGGAAAVVYYGIYGAIGTSSSFSNVLATVLAILAGMMVYFIMLFVTRSIKPEELRLLPKGERLYNLYRKLVPRRTRGKR